MKTFLWIAALVLAGSELAFSADTGAVTPDAQTWAGVKTFEKAPVFRAGATVTGNVAVSASASSASNYVISGGTLSVTGATGSFSLLGTLNFVRQGMTGANAYTVTMTTNGGLIVTGAAGSRLVTGTTGSVTITGPSWNVSGSGGTFVMSGAGLTATGTTTSNWNVSGVASQVQLIGLTLAGSGGQVAAVDVSTATLEVSGAATLTAGLTVTGNVAATTISGSFTGSQGAVYSSFGTGTGGATGFVHGLGSTPSVYVVYAYDTTGVTVSIGTYTVAGVWTIAAPADAAAITVTATTGLLYKVKAWK